MNNEHADELLDNNPYLPEPNEIPHRNAIIQGRLIIFPRTAPRTMAGGGKRSNQNGHRVASARRLQNELLTCKPCHQVAWLTYEAVQGPKKVGGNFRSFMKRLERHQGMRIAALAKMEVQQRLAPELGILLWPEEEMLIEEAVIATIWRKVCPTSGRVKLEPVRDWSRLASYLSKTVAVGMDGIYTGGVFKPFLLPVASSFIKSTHNPAMESKPDNPTNQISAVQSFCYVRDEWHQYRGRYHWRYRRDDIPHYPETAVTVTVKEADEVRGKVNSRRRKHFIGREDRITLRGEDAIAFNHALGFNPLYEE